MPPPYIKGLDSHDTPHTRHALQLNASRRQDAARRELHVAQVHTLYTLMPLPQDAPFIDDSISSIPHTGQLSHPGDSTQTRLICLICLSVCTLPSSSSPPVVRVKPCRPRAPGAARVSRVPVFACVRRCGVKPCCRGRRPAVPLPSVCVALRLAFEKKRARIEARDLVAYQPLPPDVYCTLAMYSLLAPVASSPALTRLIL